MTPVDGYVRGTPPGYAILVSGAWGSGKSYWWSKFSQTLHLVDRTPITMSAAGLASYDDLEAALFQASIEDLGTPLLREAGKLFGRTLLRYAKIDPDEIRLKADTFSGRTVICIDDIERFAGDFKVLFGFVVNLLDRDSVHCILLADEKHATKNFKKDYGRYKERIVGRTVRQKPNLSEFTLDTINGLDDVDTRTLLLSAQEGIAHQLTVWRLKNLRTVRHVISELAAIIRRCNPATGASLDSLISAVAFWSVAEAVDAKNTDLVARLFSTPGFELSYSMSRSGGYQQSSDDEPGLDDVAILVDKLGFAGEVYQWPNSREFANYVLGEEADFDQIAADFGLREERDERPMGHRLVAELNGYRNLEDRELQELIASARAYLLGRRETSLGVMYDLYRTVNWLAYSGLTSFSQGEWKDEVLASITGYPRPLPSAMTADIEYMRDSMDEYEREIRAALDVLSKDVQKLNWEQQQNKFIEALLSGEGELPDLVGNAPVFRGVDAAGFNGRLRRAGVSAVRRFGGLLRQARRVSNAASFAAADAPFYESLAQEIRQSTPTQRPMTILDSDLAHVARDVEAFASQLGSPGAE